MPRALALLAVAGGVGVLFATAAQPQRHLIGFGWTRTVSAACYRTSWTKHLEPVTRRIPCAQPATAPPSVAMLSDGQAVPLPAAEQDCTTPSGTETILTPVGRVRATWACGAVSSTG